MAAELPPAADRERLLDEVLTEYLRAVDAGRDPDRGELLARHPDLAGDIERFLDDQDVFARWAEPVRRLHQTPKPGATDPTGPAPVGSFGDYELLGPIARGGMGVVFRARQRGVPRVVALKVIRAGGAADADDVRRFRNEVETVARLEHPGIVPIYDAGERDGALYFSMKLYEGGSLADRPDRFTADPRGAARLVSGLARAVHHAHQRGVLHRDLKPSNVLLDEGGRPVVSDFGLARRLDAGGDLTRSGVLVGTPSYMAPEQAAGRPGAATTAADVYGLGAILYALLTGRPPFRGETAMETLEQVRTRDPEPPRRLNPRVERDLETVCLKCLEKNPAGRYGSAAGLAEDLDRFLAGEPVRARRAGRPERAWKWARRNPAWAALLAVVALAAAGGVAGVLWSNAQLRDAAARERDAAEAARRQAERADRERDLAREEQRRAAAAVDDMYTRVAEEWLGPSPRLQPLQREFLEKALAYYEYAAARWGDDPAVRRKVPELHLRIGTISAALGRHGRADEAFRRAVAGFGELVSESPADAAARSNAFDAHTRMAGVLIATGRLPEAADMHRRAGELAARLAADFPDRPDFARYPAVAKGNLAFALAEAGRYREAEAAYRDALPALERLAARDGDRLKDRFALANTRTNLGKLYQEAGRPADAEPLFAAAAAGFERLAREVPANTEYRWQLATALSNLGTALISLKRHGEARADLSRAEGLLDRLAADFPDLPDAPSDLAAVRINLGIALRALGEPGEAEQSYRRAITTLGGLVARLPGVPAHRRRLGAVQQNLGRLLQDAGRLADSEQALRAAVATYRGLAAVTPVEVPGFRAEWANAQFHLGIVLTRAGKSDAADEAYSRALDLQEGLLAGDPANPSYRAAAAQTCGNLATVLALDQGPPYPGARRAEVLARKAVELAPGQAAHWRALGLAEFRSGNWRESLAALARVRELGSDNGPFEFVEAMAHQRLGVAGKARDRYDAASRWLGARPNPHPNDLRLRDEAAATLGIVVEGKREQAPPPRAVGR